MAGSNVMQWSFWILTGFLSGSLMFCSLIPRTCLHMDIEACSDDRNPGAANVFLHCGTLWGLVCLTLDLLKGCVPVLLAQRTLDTQNLWFGIVLAAPVLGHGLAPLHHWRGGKCIATAFGVLLGILPESPILLVLAGVYILFSTLLKINPNRLRSIAAFGVFGIISLSVLLKEGQGSLALGCSLISLTAIVKHSRYFLPMAENTCVQNEKGIS